MTVFIVDYIFTKPPRTQKLPSAAKKEDEKVSNRIILTSSNPSGEDCYEIARRLVLGPNPYAGSDFRVLSCQRMVDSMGLVGVTTWEKLDGKAPENVGVTVVDDDEDDEGGGEGSIPPPAAALN